MHRWLRLMLLPLTAWSLLPLAACSPDYPFDRKGTWSLPPGELGANDANLRATIADPNDLTAGAAEDGSVGNEAAAPVRRMVSGQRPRLPTTSGTPLESTDAQMSATPGQAGTNGIVQQQ
jgi:hypothetical protein